MRLMLRIDTIMVKIKEIEENLELVKENLPKDLKVFFGISG